MNYQDEAEAHYEQGKKYIKENKHGDAIRELQKAIAISPECEKAYVSLGSIYIQEKFLKYTGDDFFDIFYNDLASELNSNKNKNDLEKLALIYFTLGNAFETNLKDGLDATIECYENACVANDNVPLYHYYAGKLLIKDNWEKGYRHLEKALSLKPDYLKPKLAWAEHFNELGEFFLEENDDPEMAIYNFGKAAELIPDYDNYHIKLGMAYEKDGQMDEAINEYKTSIKLNYENPLYHYILAKAYWSQEIFNDAEYEIREAIQFAPNNDEYYAALGLILFQIDLQKIDSAEFINTNARNKYESEYATELFDESIKAYETAIKINPNKEEYHFNVGVVYYNKLNYDYNYIVKQLNKGSSDIYLNIQLFEYLLQLYKKTISELNITISKSDPSRNIIYENIEQIRDFISLIKQLIDTNIDAGTNYIKSELVSSPNSYKLHYALGFYLKEKEQSNDAIEELNKALKINPNSYECYNLIGLIKHDQGHYKVAIENYKKAIEIYYNDARIHNNLGLSLKKYGDIKSAMAEFLSAYKIDHQEVYYENWEAAQYELSSQSIDNGDVDWKQFIQQNNESKHLEYKQSMRWSVLDKDHSLKSEFIIAKVISSFLNTDGGILIIGVSDGKRVIGLDKDYGTVSPPNKEGFTSRLNLIVTNYLGKHCLEHVDSFTEIIENKEICIVRVDKCDSPVFVTDKKKNTVDFYFRSSSTSNPCTLVEFFNYYRSHWLNRLSS